MSRIEKIEGQIMELNLDEIRAPRDWFDRHDADLWDSQIEADANNGKLAALANQALNDHENGLSTEL